MARIRALETEALAALKGAVADGFRGIGAVMDRLVPLERVFWRLHARNGRVERKREMLADREARAEVREALGGLEALRAWEARARALEAAESDAGESGQAAGGDEGEGLGPRVRGDEGCSGREMGSVGADSPGPCLRRGERGESRRDRDGSEREGAGPRSGGDEQRDVGRDGSDDAEPLGPCLHRDERIDVEWRLPRLRRRGAARRGLRPRRAREGRTSVLREARIAVWPCELMTRAERRGRGVSFRVRAQDRVPVVVGGLVMRPVELPYPDF